MIKIIAEVGINHDGVVAKAKELIGYAADSGCHGVKFQYRNIGNVYSDTFREIGDEILLNEIKRTYLPPETLLDLASFGKELGLEVGISFFDERDILDFSDNISVFDFYKIPSVELLNGSLIEMLLKLDGLLYLSTGAHTEKEIESALRALPESGWMPLHCISNYPVTLQNARLGYLLYMQRIWKRDIGYSSHDDHWEVCLLAMQMGAKVIERHITLDRDAAGLDHSTSSLPEEFEKIAMYASNMDVLLTGNGPRVPNQGELLNRQNLGRSYFVRQNLNEGHVLQKTDIGYHSPNIGINKTNIGRYLNQPLRSSVKQGSPLTESLFHDEELLPEDVISTARKYKLSLPVRLHDLHEMERLFPIGAYEFHLSYGEVLSNIDLDKVNAASNYSIHLPDYVSSTQLMDPFSDDAGQRESSELILERTVELAARLQDKCGCSVPVVGSFSVVHTNRAGFFEQHAALLKSYLQRDVLIVPQWLPPIAWYFGGSVRLHVMNDMPDAQLICDQHTGVCLDICHMLLGKNFFGFSCDHLMEMLGDEVKHIHIADAAGIDGEGLPVGEGDPDNLPIIRKSLDYDCYKVIEVWQGHFDNGAGFRKALMKMAEICNER